MTRSKYYMVNTIKDEKKNIEDRISQILNHRHFMVTVEIMTQTWIIKSSLDWLRKMLMSEYVDNEITYNQYRLMHSYLESYENDVWSRLYNMAQKNDNKNLLLKGGEN